MDKTVRKQRRQTRTGVTTGQTLDIRETLGLEDAFADYILEEDRIDQQGWNSTHPLFETAITTVKPSLVIELGVWKGMSSIHMAGLMKSQNLDGKILSIDTWLGSSNHLSGTGRRAELRPQDGYPTIYRTFLANVKKAGHDDMIVPLPMDGHSAAHALTRLGVKAGVIHIDASHEYTAALADFRAFWPLLADDGILLCDDYVNWAGVTRAANEFAAEVDRPIFGSATKALIPKDPSVTFDVRLSAARHHGRLA